MDQNTPTTKRKGPRRVIATAAATLVFAASGALTPAMAGHTSDTQIPTPRTFWCWAWPTFCN